MVKDDREEFELDRLRRTLALGQDKEAFQRAVETIIDLDRHHYSYLWTWLGAPIIQLPADILATQEVIWNEKPDIIIETGVARGGSMIFLASMLQLLGAGRVIGVDIDIRAHNRNTVEAHPLAHRITLIEGPSTHAAVLAEIKSEISEDAKVMVILDSDHSRNHVLDELRTYSKLVTSGQYLVVADTLLGCLTEEQTPKARSKIWKPGDEPLAAVETFLAETDQFEVDPAINGKLVLSSSPGGYLKRK